MEILTIHNQYKNIKFEAKKYSPTCVSWRKFKKPDNAKTKSFSSLRANKIWIYFIFKNSLKGISFFFLFFLMVFFKKYHMIIEISSQFFKEIKY